MQGELGNKVQRIEHLHILPENLVDVSDRVGILDHREKDHFVICEAEIGRIQSV